MKFCQVLLAGAFWFQFLVAYSWECSICLMSVSNGLLGSHSFLNTLLLFVSNRSFGILHTSECLMVDVPRLDHLWDGQKEHHRNEKVICYMRPRTTGIPNSMLLQAPWQSCHAWITCRRGFRFIVVTTDNDTRGTTSYMGPGCMQHMDMHT